MQQTMRFVYVLCKASFFLLSCTKLIINLRVVLHAPDIIMSVSSATEVAEFHYRQIALLIKWHNQSYYLHFKHVRYIAWKPLVILTAVQYFPDCAQVMNCSCF